MSEAERGGPPEPATTYNLLFVCSGNTCRSPMAAAVARDALRQRGWTHVAVRSAGLSALTGAPAAQNAIKVSAEKGLDLTGHEARTLTPELVEWADLILGMSMAHVADITEMGGGAKAALITDFDESAGPGSGIADPFGGTAATYRTALRQINRAVEGVLRRLEPILAP